MNKNNYRCCAFFAHLTIASVFLGCGADYHDVNDDHAHGHGEGVTQTILTNKSELFVEYKPLIVGEVSRFAAHFTRLIDYKPITSGSVTVSLVNTKKGVRSEVDAPSSPGIFTPSIKPVQAGDHTLVFIIESSMVKDTIKIEHVKVYESSKMAEAETSSDDEDVKISFLKEQAWKMEFGLARVRKDTIYQSIPTSGQILAAQGDERTISSTAEGILLYAQSDFVQGCRVEQGSNIFTITGGDISEGNVSAAFKMAQAKFNREKSSFDRNKQLFDKKVIPKADYELAQMQFNLAKSEFEAIAKNYSNGAKQIKAPFGGFVKSLLKREGEFVQIGEPLGVVTMNKKLTIRVNVAQSNFNQLNDAMKANFKLSDTTILTLQELDGKLLSYGKSVDENLKVPVFFEVKNVSELLPGSFVEIWLLTNPKPNRIVIPKEALLEEFGKYSVIVQVDGESYEERNVNLGINNGRTVEIISGLKEGEVVVTKGAYQVKMAAMSGQVPAHGHSH